MRPRHRVRRSPTHLGRYLLVPIPEPPTIHKRRSETHPLLLPFDAQRATSPRIALREGQVVEELDLVFGEGEDVAQLGGAMPQCGGRRGEDGEGGEVDGEVAHGA
ncbi:hypothetical protein JCM24511_05574 [Saitozyma sp. JCM 24511]|nr:hypothetical protein JCM24511_05574 [Saitozyma sp. JCM 24511]